MGYSLPSGVVNTDSVYYYADNTLTLGPLVKQPTDQTLIVVDYSNVEPPISAISFQFNVDVTSNPKLVVSYPQINATAEVLTFLVSGGIVGQQYNISVLINTGTDTRTDVLTINIPSYADCDCATVQLVPTLYTSIPLGDPTQGYVNSAVRYFFGSAPPNNPTVMDQWYNVPARILYEYATDGTNYFWQTIWDSRVVLDAPQSGLIFGRGNNTWQVIPIQSDAPYNNSLYARQNGGWTVIPTPWTDAPAITRGYWRFNNGWVQDPIQTDVPANDGQSYVRSNQAWLQVPTPFPDAPSTSQLFARINTNWQAIPVQTDAYPDGQIYGRQNYQWVPVPLSPIPNDAPDTGVLYGRMNGQWVPAYPAGNPDGYLLSTDAANTYYPLSNPSNYITTAQVAGQYMPLLGGTFTGAVTFQIGGIFQSPANLYIGGGSAGQALVTNGTGQLTWAAPPGGVTDAPSDGTLYARESGAWQHITHTDITDWTAALAPYALISSIPTVPSASISLPLMDSVANAGSGTTWSRADHVHPTDTSRYSASNPSGYQTAAQVTAALGPYALTSALPVASNAIPAMNSVGASGSSVAYTRGDHVHPSDTTKLSLSGGTMTGALILNADPTAPLGAATMQYVTNSVSNANIDCGTF